MEADLHAIERDLDSIRARSSGAPGDASDVHGRLGRTRDDGSRRAVVPRGAAEPARGIGERWNVRRRRGRRHQPRDRTAPSEVATATATVTDVPDVPDVPDAGDGTTIDLFGEEQAASEAAALDDDSFFASLRDAVRDDAPLGPRDATSAPSSIRTTRRKARPSARRSSGGASWSGRKLAD